MVCPWSKEALRLTSVVISFNEYRAEELSALDQLSPCQYVLGGYTHPATCLAGCSIAASIAGEPEPGHREIGSNASLRTIADIKTVHCLQVNPVMNSLGDPELKTKDEKGGTTFTFLRVLCHDSHRQCSRIGLGAAVSTIVCSIWNQTMCNCI